MQVITHPGMLWYPEPRILIVLDNLDHRTWWDLLRQSDLALYLINQPCTFQVIKNRFGDHKHVEPELRQIWDNFEIIDKDAHNLLIQLNEHDLCYLRLLAH